MVMEVEVPKPKEKGKAKGTAFHYDGSAESFYKEDGKPATWQQVQDAVGVIMKARGFTWESVSGMQKLLPAVIFKLADEVDQLTAAQIKPPKGQATR